MVVGTVPEAVDFVIAGAGPGGYVAALHAARAGRRVTLVDRDGEDGVGGVCLTVGCIPSKALIETADLAHRATTAAAQGVLLESRGFDGHAFQSWKGSVVDKLTGGVRQLLAQAGVTVIGGELSLLDEKTAVINRGDNAAALFFKFKDLLLATGSAPIKLSALPVDGETIIDSTGALSLTVLPKRLAVVGGGYIGLEIGIAMAKLGVDVSIVEMQSRVLPTMDASISQVLSASLRSLGMTCHFGVQASGFDDGHLTLENAAGERSTVAVDKVLVAVGRRPNSDALDLPKARITPANNGQLPVAPDRRLSRHIAAIGDLTPGLALAHKASAEAQVAVDALCGKTTAFEPSAIPAVVFSDPEVASAGMSTEQAQAEGIAVIDAKFPVAASGRAATLGDRNGFAQIIADADDGTVLGVHIVAPHASDLIAEAVLAIEMRVTLEDLALTIHPHPTLSEMVAEAAQVGLGRPVHGSAPRK